MKSNLRTLTIIAATAATTAAATTVLPLTARQQQASAPAAAALAAQQSVAATPPQLVSGLPDFTQLVERVGPAVVNVEATGSGHAQAARGGMPDDEEMPEFFRRFFGPDMPMPNGPGGRRGAPDDQDDGPKPVSLGSGFLISADGYLLTNHHVVDGADKVRVKLSDRREFDARVVGSDPQSDVALLKIPASGLPYLRAGESKQLKPGQWVVAIGSPFGLDHSVTAGIVSAVGRNAGPEQRYVPFIQTDVAINRGNSGGPLLNTRGEVVGINSQIFSNSGGYMGVSFAIPMDVALNVSDQLKAHGKVTRGQIGVVVGAVNAETAKGFGLPDTRGALVNDVRDGSPAEKAGLQPGDVIRSVDGSPIEDSSDLPPVIGAMAPGSSVKLGILREGKPIERTVTLAKLDESDGNGSAPSAPAPEKRDAAGPANRLGLIGEELDADDRRTLGLKPGEGVGVARVDGKAVRRAGLAPGDVILRVGTTPVGSVAALDRELGKTRGDQTVMLLVRRGGATQFVPVVPDDKG